MNKLQDFINLLFDEGDKVFIGQDLFSGSVVSKNEARSGQFFCLNACDNGRKKSDIRKFRNFLVEIDKIPGTDEPMSRRDQILLIHQKYGVPFSTAVSSGNKSIHFIISLEEPLDNLEDYQYIAKWIKNIISEADSSVLVPEKLSRFLGGINSKTQNEQKGFIPKGGRVSNARFLEWLNKYADKKPQMETDSQPKVQVHNIQRDGILQIVRWYIYEYLRSSYNNIRGHYQCPVCASEGFDKSRNNLYVSSPAMKFHCFAVDAHNKLIFREMRSLYYKNKHVRKGE